MHNRGEQMFQNDTHWILTFVDTLISVEYTSTGTKWFVISVYRFLPSFVIFGSTIEKAEFTSPAVEDSAFQRINLHNVQQILPLISRRVA